MAFNGDNDFGKSPGNGFEYTGSNGHAGTGMEA